LAPSTGAGDHMVRSSSGDTKPREKRRPPGRSSEPVTIINNHTNQSVTTASRPNVTPVPGIHATVPDARMAPSNSTRSSAAMPDIDATTSSVKGVSAVVSGYAGGKAGQPTYEEVCTGRTGHVEVVQIEFDPVEIEAEPGRPDDVRNMQRSEVELGWCGVVIAE